MRPIFLPPNRVWRTYPGGKILDKIEGKKVQQDSHFPEDWIASTTRAVNKGRETIIDEGISRLISGQLLTNILMQNPIEVLGKSYYEKYGPCIKILVKFLDSTIRLHFKYHPTIVKEFI
jgi:mannose-6-phosphate isomerase